MGLAAAGIVDVDPVLRHFGARKEIARKEFRRFVMVGIKQGHRNEFYLADEGQILGSEEFVEAMIHRLGQTPRRGKDIYRITNPVTTFDAAALVQAVAKNYGVAREKICSRGKNMRLMRAKEAMILVGRRLGA